MPQCVEIAIKLAPAFITCVLGSIGAYIAYQQHTISRDKLNLDKFDKRFAAYEKLQEYFSMLLREGHVTDEAIAVLSQARYKSLFLFGTDIDDHVKQLWEKAFEMRKVYRQLYGENSLPVCDERTRVAARETELMNWNSAQQEASPQWFAKYLHLA